MNFVGSDGVTLSHDEVVRSIARESIAEWLASEARQTEIQDVIGSVVRQVGALLLDMRAGIVAEIGRTAGASLPGALLLDVKRARRSCADLDEALRLGSCPQHATFRRAIADVDASLHRVEVSIVRDSGAALGPA